MTFPSSPFVGQTFWDHGRSYTWDGTDWIWQNRLPIATTERLGGVIVGQNLAITEEGLLSSRPPIATHERLGGVIVGENLTISEDGILSATVQEGGGGGGEGDLHYHTGDSPPDPIYAKHLWLDTVTARVYHRFTDPDSTQWVEF